MSDNVINIPRESTMKALMEMQKMAVAGGANPGAATFAISTWLHSVPAKSRLTIFSSNGGNHSTTQANSQR
mgnify:CR=1 FL=1